MSGFNSLCNSQLNSMSTLQTETDETSYFAKNNLLKIFLNISGFKYEISIKNLKRLSTSRLGQICLASSIDQINNLCDNFNREIAELYFDRDPSIFNNILNYYRTGKLHVSENICIIAFKEELDYWGVSEFFLDKCCNLKFYIKKEAYLDEIKKIEDYELKIIQKETFNNCCPITRKKIWDIVDKPETSILAKVNKL